MDMLLRHTSSTNFIYTLCKVLIVSIFSQSLQILRIMFFIVMFNKSKIISSTFMIMLIISALKIMNFLDDISVVSVTFFVKWKNLIDGL